MDPIAVDVPKTPTTPPSLPGKPSAKPEPGKPPFTSPSATPAAGSPSTLGRVAQIFGFQPTRKNGLILAAAACSLVAGIAVVKLITPGSKPAETTQPLVAEAKPQPQEQPKVPGISPVIPASLPAAPTITENRAVYEPSAPIPPASLPAIPATSPGGSFVPATPPASLPAVPFIPATTPEPFAPGISKSGSAPSVILPEIPSTIIPPAVLPASASEPMKPGVPPMVPPTAPSVPSTPAVPPVSPVLPELPSVPPLAPSVPSTPSVPPVTPSTPAIPPAMLPTVPSTTPPSIVPPSTSPVSAVPPAMLPAVPPAKPLSIEYTKSPGTSAVSPDRAAVTSFDVDLYDPRQNDTYTTISKEFYNDAKYAAALQEYNGRRPLQSGQHVEVPPIHVLKKRYAQMIGAVVPASGTSSLPPAKAGDPWGPSTEATPAFRPTGQRTFTVPTGGMTMGAVARDTLGSPSRWREIYDLNPQLSPGEVLPAGTVVKIPGDVKPN